MKVVDSYRLFLTPLSPVHIGTGYSYAPTNYIIEKETLHEFDIGDVAQLLSESERESLLKIVNGRPSVDMIKAVQSFFYNKRSELIACARNRIPVLPGVAELYLNRVGKTAQQEERGRRIINQLEISRTAFNPGTHLPVLLGSSLKGAIRTALLNDINKGCPLRMVPDPKTGGLRPENNKELQERLFAFQAGKFELDPLRLVQLGDAIWSGQPGLPATEVHFEVNRKKEHVRDEKRSTRQSRAQQRDLYTILECLPALRYRAMSAQLNIQNVDGLSSSGKLPAPDLRFDIHHIASACNSFYVPILKNENSMLSGLGLISDSWLRDINTLLNGEIGSMLSSGKAFILRAGRHSGAESVTLPGVRNIKIMKGKGRPPEFSNSAKTIWLAAKEARQRTEMLPFGWILVEVMPMDGSDETASQSLKDICECSLGSDLRSWAENQAQLAEERMRQQIEKEAQRLRREEVIRLKEEEQAMLAALSPEERAIEDLRKIYEADKAANRRDAGGELANCRIELLKRAKEWQDPELRRKAADLISQTTKLIPWPKKKQADRAKELEDLLGKRMT